METEVWKSYDERYEVSSFGNVRNEKRLLKLTVDKYGYLVVGIHREIKKVHQLVAICFLNHTPNGYEIVVDHIDNNPLNNHNSNLQLITHRENSSKDKKRKLPLGVQNNGNMFQSKIYFNGKNIHLGLFDTPQEASECYQNALKSI